MAGPLWFDAGSTVPENAKCLVVPPELPWPSSVLVSMVWRENKGGGLSLSGR